MKLFIYFILLATLSATDDRGDNGRRKVASAVNESSSISEVFPSYDPSYEEKRKKSSSDSSLKEKKKKKKKKK